MGIGHLRNDLCKCGSEKKYKYCCYPKTPKHEHIPTRNNGCPTCKDAARVLSGNKIGTQREAYIKSL